MAQVAERSRVDGLKDAGQRRTAEDEAGRQFLAPEGNWDVPSGFEKIDDTIVVAVFLMALRD
jgi:hypothetical protein